MFEFTGKERDAELAGSAMQGLDYFGARYFSAQGRFTSADPVTGQDIEANVTREGTKEKPRR